MTVQNYLISESMLEHSLHDASHHKSLGKVIGRFMMYW